MMLLSSKTGRTHSTKFGRLRIPRGCFSPLPEWSLAFAGSVVVGRRWTVSLLLLVMLAKQKLQDSRKEEQNTALYISTSSKEQYKKRKRLTRLRWQRQR